MQLCTLCTFSIMSPTRTRTHALLPILETLHKLHKCISRRRALASIGEVFKTRTDHAAWVLPGLLYRGSIRDHDTARLRLLNILK
jgi:hypothetical protein